MNDEMYMNQADICTEEDSLDRFLDKDQSGHPIPTVVDQEYGDSSGNRWTLSVIEEHLKEREDARQEKIDAEILARHGSTIKMLPLTDGSVTIVDARDYHALSEFNWSRGSDGSGRMYVYRYETTEQGTRKIYIHRVITGAGAGEKVDHINGDPLDNRRCNLRATTSEGNAQNRRKVRSYKKRLPSSQYKGVTWDRTRSKYRARIYKAGRRYYLGYLSDPVAAARAYDRAAVEMFEVPRLNFAYPEPALMSA